MSGLCRGGALAAWSPRPGWRLVIGYPPRDVRWPIAFDKPVIAFGQDLGVEPIMGESVDGFDIFPKRERRRGVAVLPIGKESGTDVPNAPVTVTVSVVFLPTITRPV